MFLCGVCVGVALAFIVLAITVHLAMRARRTLRMCHIEITQSNIHGMPCAATISIAGADISSAISDLRNHVMDWSLPPRNVAE
jgi:hypothetical protein